MIFKNNFIKLTENGILLILKTKKSNVALTPVSHEFVV